MILLEKKAKNPKILLSARSQLSHFESLNRSPLTLRCGRWRKARASPRRGGEPRDSVIRALGDSRANTLAVASPLGESPNYVVLPRGGGRRAPPAAPHTTCMVADILFCEPRLRPKIPKCFVIVYLSTVLYCCMLYCTVLYCTYCTVYTVQYSTVDADRRSSVQYSTVPGYPVHCRARPPSYINLQ